MLILSVHTRLSLATALLVAFTVLALPAGVYAFPAVLGSRIIANQLFIDGQQVISPTTVMNASAQPTFTGYTLANAQLALTIHSETVRGSALTDANGYWSYTPAEPLEAGQHTLAITTTDRSGVTGSEVLSATFAVGGGQVKGALTSFPVTGVLQNPRLDYLAVTFIVLGSLAVLGAFYAFLLRRPIG